MRRQLIDQGSGNEYDLAHLRAPGHPPLGGRHLIEVKDTPGNGLGILARTHIPKGLRIITETPLLKAEAFSGHGVNTQEAFDRLSPVKQRAYRDLHGYASQTLKKDNDWASLPELNRKVLTIFFANRWGRDVFWLTSRFNRSCIPNVHNAYNPIIRIETFHSIRDIVAGEEPTISYLSGISVRDER
jgi:SET domain-containing protein